MRIEDKASESVIKPETKVSASGSESSGSLGSSIVKNKIPTKSDGTAARQKPSTPRHQGNSHFFQHTSIPKDSVAAETLKSLIPSSQPTISADEDDSHPRVTLQLKSKHFTGSSHSDYRHYIRKSSVGSGGSAGSASSVKKPDEIEIDKEKGLGGLTLGCGKV